MAKTNKNYSILVGVELDTSTIQQQLNEKSKELKFDSNQKEINDLTLSVQAANEVFSKSVDVIATMVEQVYELDTALTE